MNVAVCIKQVLHRDARLPLDDFHTWIDEADADFELNEPDAYALEEALRLKEVHGGTVIVCSAGPARVVRALREALARGADRAIHIQGDHLAAADPVEVAGVIAAALCEEDLDLVLTGLQSDDHGSGQTGVILAERLGLPHATIVMEIQVATDGLRVKRELEAGWFQWIFTRTPAVLTIQSGINRLRYATLKGIMAAKKKDVRVLAAASVTSTARQRIRRLVPPAKRRTGVLLSGSPAAAANELIRRLRDEARVL